MPTFSDWVNLPRVGSEIKDQLNRIEEKVNKIMTEQSQQATDIAAAVTAIGNVETEVSAVAADLQTAASNIQAEIAALKAANPSVDTTALDAAVAGLSAPITALQSADTAVDALETLGRPARARYAARGELNGGTSPMTTTTPAEPTPAPAPVTVPAPAAHPHGLAGWLEAHVFPEVKTLEADAAKARALLPEAEQGAAKLVGVAQTLEALISTADPVLGTQIGASAAVLREIAEGLAAAAKAL